MIHLFKKKWRTNEFEILILSCIILLLLFCLFRVGKKGTYTDIKYYNKIIGYLPNKKRNYQQISKNRSDSKPEIYCRQVLENYFNMPFAKARPDFLKNPVTENFNLELDCFNPNLRLAIEYNGIQHYKYTPFFHKNKETFMLQKYRDELKRRMCRDNRITLIEVPYTIKFNDIPRFILQQLETLGY